MNQSSKPLLKNIHVFTSAMASDSQADGHVVRSVAMKSTLRILGLASLLLVLAVSLVATNSPAQTAPTDTNFVDPQIAGDNPPAKQLIDAMKNQGIQADKLLDEHFLFASLLWGSVGAGYLIYARKQRMIVPFVGGVLMIGVSYFITSWVWMSVVCIALMVAVYQLLKRGY